MACNIHGHAQVAESQVVGFRGGRVERVFDSLSQPWLGTVLAVLGLAAAVFFYRRSRRVSRLAYQFDEVTLLGSSRSAFSDEVEIRFSGRVVPRVTAARLIVWNAGNTTLRGSDIVQADPLRVHLQDEGIILKASVVRVTRDVNDFAVSLEGQGQPEAALAFDYLDPGDGALLEVLHSGGRRALQIAGTMRGLRLGPQSFGRMDAFPERTQSLPRFVRVARSNLVMVPMLALGVIGLVLGFMQPLLHDNITMIYGSASGPPNYDQPAWYLVITGALYVTVTGVMIWTRRRRYPTELGFGEECGPGIPTTPGPAD